MGQKATKLALEKVAREIGILDAEGMPTDSDPAPDTASGIGWFQRVLGKR